MTRFSSAPNEKILGFYSGTMPDDHGRYLPDIQRWPDDELESVHDFIQWMFPLVDPSPVNPRAPVLDAETMVAFRSRPDLQQNLRASFLRMLQFYGLRMTASPPVVVEKAPNFDSRVDNWLSSGNHNHLRITRIIRSLRLLGLEREAQALFGCLSDIYAAEQKKRWPAISSTTFQFWSSAAGDPV
jgi:opioid growth factor receptor-like protein